MVFFFSGKFCRRIQLKFVSEFIKILNTYHVSLRWKKVVIKISPIIVWQTSMKYTVVCFGANLSAIGNIYWFSIAIIHHWKRKFANTCTNTYFDLSKGGTDKGIESVPKYIRFGFCYVSIDLSLISQC